MRALLLVAAMLAATACAAHSPGRDVAAVVEDESARQAAVISARQGEDSREALATGAEAAARTADPGDPPH